MPKSKVQKQATVSSLTAGLKEAKGAVFANFQGLTVAQTEALRKSSRQANVTMLAAKKTLVKRAFDKAGLGVDPAVFAGGVATFLGRGDELAAAKVVSAYAKKHDVMTIFGGILEGKFIDAAAVTKLSALPGRPELLSQMVGSLNAPISGFVNVCAGTIRGLMNVLNAYQEKKPA